MTAQQAQPGSRPRPWLWGGLFLLNMAWISAAHIFDYIEQPVPIILIAFNMLLMIPMYRSSRQLGEMKGLMSPALRRYNRRILACGITYIAAMILGPPNIYDPGQPPTPLLWLVALLPVIPLLAMIWSMYRYYFEEDDEFLRHRAVSGALVGLVLVLVLGTVWGFLEMFGLLPHIWTWWVTPVWAIGLGIGTCWPIRRTGDGQ